MVKKIIPLAILLAVWQNWSNISGLWQPKPQFTTQPTVILYATQWCGYCKKVRAFFADNNIEYEEYDVENSYIGMKEYKQLGGKGVPLVKINKNLVRGYNVPELEKLLNL